MDRCWSDRSASTSEPKLVLSAALLLPGAIGHEDTSGTLCLARGFGVEVTADMILKGVHLLGRLTRACVRKRKSAAASECVFVPSDNISSCGRKQPFRESVVSSMPGSYSLTQSTS